MALITNNLKFYIPEINDPNYVYVKGFADNFYLLDEKLNDLLTMEVADTTSTENITKRALTDLMSHKWEGHILSKTDDPSSIENEGTYGDYYNVNPHKVTPSQLYVADADKVGLTGRLTSADGMVYDINNNLTIEGTLIARHRINWEFVNTQSGKLADIGSSIADRPHSDLLYLTLDETGTGTAKDKHLSNAQAKIWQDHTETIDKATSNPHNTSAQNLKSTDSSHTGGQAIQRAVNQQGITSGIDWVKISKVGSDLTEITTRNHDDLQNIVESVSVSRDATKNKHTSNLDTNELWGHLKSKSSDDANIKDVDGIGVGLTDYPTAKVNPHEVRPRDLWSEDTVVRNHGADVIINEINTNGSSEGLTTPNTVDKIYWNLIDKNNIDGLGNGANINTIPDRSHQELQNILPAVVTSSDTALNKHVSDSQVKKYEEHVDDNDKNTANPHNTSAQNVKSTTSSNTGGVAISEAINEQSATNAIDWIKINKATSNLTEIVTRNHDDLQSINVLDPTSTDAIKNKHLSNAQAKQYQDHIEMTNKATDNPHNTSAQNLKSATSLNTGGIAIQEGVNEQGNDAGINWSKVSKATSNLTEIVTRNHDDLQNIEEVDVLDSDVTKNKHINNLLANKWDLHSEYISGGNPHRNTATNLYTIASEKNGGKAIAEAINLQALSSSIDWVKLNKAGSNLTDIVTRSHQDLQNILGASSSTDGTQNKHVSNLDFKNWEDHRANASNPHNVTAAQFGGNSIVDVINSGSTTSDINRDRLNLVGFDITEIETRNHDDLQNKGELDVADTDTAKNKHISNAQGKKFEDHVNISDGTNPHMVEASNIPIDLISGVAASNVQTALEDIALKTTYNSAGLLETTGTVTVDGTGVLIQANDFSIYHTANFTNKLHRETIPQKHFLTADFTDGKINYVYAHYNISTQAKTYETTDDLNVLNWSNEVICAIVYRGGVSLEALKLTAFGNGTTEKILMKDREVKQFETVEGGLFLGDDSDKDIDGVTPINHHFKVSSGVIWSVLEKFQTNALSTRTNNLTWYYTVGSGDWNTQSVSAPIIWKIDTGTGVIDPALTDIYIANWIYKDVFNDSWYIVIGSEAYDSVDDVGFKLGYANAQPPGTLPEIIRERSVLIGKVVTEKDTVINEAIYRTQGLLFTNTSTGFQPIDEHNALSNIQGGEAGEYYHLTVDQINKLNSVEQNADITDLTNVGNSITDIIFNNTSDEDITIDEVYTLAKSGANDMVEKAGDRMTGLLSIQKTGLAFAIGSDLDGDYLGGSDAWFRMGDNSLAFNHVYTGSESGINSAYELWTTNGNGTPSSAYNINTTGRVWRVTQDGVFNIYKNIISNSNIKVESLNVDTTVDIIGQTKILKGSTDWRDTVIFNDASTQLGQPGGGYAGSIKLWGSDVGRYSLIRMHKTNFFLDTAGKYYVNWDYTETPGEFYLGDGEQYTTVEETRANYLVLRSNDKSYFKNGLQVGTTSNRVGYAMNVGGAIDMGNEDVNYLRQVHFNSHTRFVNQSNSVLNFMAEDANTASMHFYTGGASGVFKGSFLVDGNYIGLKNKDDQWVIANDGGDTSIYRNGVIRIRATTTGATVEGNLIITGTMSEDGSLLSARYLGLTAKAADSNLIDGIDSSRIIYGLNSHGTSNGRIDINTIVKTGHYWGGGDVINAPSNGHGSAHHVNHDGGNDYATQFYIEHDASKYAYFRSKDNGTWSSWNTIFSTNNKPTKTDVGLGNLPNAKSDAINLDDTNVLATSKAVKTAYDLASAASESAQNADNAHLLDNLDSTQFVRSDVNDDVTGVLSINNDIKVRNILLKSASGWEDQTQKGNIVYNHSDTLSLIAGFQSLSNIKIGHSATGVSTDIDIDGMLIQTGDINVKEVIARGNINFSRSGIKKASMEYNEASNSIDFVF